MTTERSDDAPRADEAPRSAKIIKRYSNRKLYDTERSKYVTLDEIAKMIKAGEEVTIIDNETKEDLTSVTLTQIIFEEEKRESRMPLAMLRNLIQTGGETLQEFFDRSVKAPVVEIKGAAQKSVEELREGAATLRTAATRSVSEWTDTARRVFIRTDADKKADEFRRACHSSFDELAKRIDLRIKEVSALREGALLEAAGEKAPTGDLKAPTGDLKAPTGDLKAPTGDLKVPTGEEKPPTGEEKPATSDVKPATSDVKPATSDVKPATGDVKPATGDVKPATSDVKPATGDVKPATGDVKPATGDLPSGEPSGPGGDRVKEDLEGFRQRLKELGGLFDELEKTSRPPDRPPIVGS